MATPIINRYSDEELEEFRVLIEGKIAEAKRSADVLLAEGEAEYMQLLQSAYDTPEKAEFYSFIRSLDALRKSLTGDNKTLILDKNSNLGKMLYGE